jgi:signal transduction histidine kinase
VRMGTARVLPPGAGLVAYRICQESLTNVLKHAGPDPSVTVLTQWLPAELLLEVSDDGRGAASAASSDGLGQGLVGMRERAAMFGGTLSAGPRAGGGFRVRVNLPLPTSR